VQVFLCDGRRNTHGPAGPVDPEEFADLLRVAYEEEAHRHGEDDDNEHGDDDDNDDDHNDTPDCAKCPNGLGICVELRKTPRPLCTLDHCLPSYVSPSAPQQVNRVFACRRLVAWKLVNEYAWERCAEQMGWNPYSVPDSTQSLNDNSLAARIQNYLEYTYWDGFKVGGIVATRQFEAPTTQFIQIAHDECLDYMWGDSGILRFHNKDDKNPWFSGDSC
jgi:hypothetical protein